MNDQQIECYNKKYRKKEYPTDVLSFPVNDVVETAHYLGDILISLERAADQAKKAEHNLETELKMLLLHGLLHLLGFDHETDTGQMDRLETRLRRQLGIFSQQRAHRPGRKEND